MQISYQILFLNFFWNLILFLTQKVEEKTKNVIFYKNFILNFEIFLNVYKNIYVFILNKTNFLLNKLLAKKYKTFRGNLIKLKYLKVLLMLL